MGIPQTYMSAAGIQSEIAYKTLTRVACHEATYRKQVGLYRQSLHSRVKVIRREEVLAKRAIRRYNHVQKKNREGALVKHDCVELIPLKEKVECSSPRHKPTTGNTFSVDSLSRTPTSKSKLAPKSSASKSPRSAARADCKKKQHTSVPVERLLENIENSDSSVTPQHADGMDKTPDVQHEPNSSPQHAETNQTKQQDSQEEYCEENQVTPSYPMPTTVLRTTETSDQKQQSTSPRKKKRSQMSTLELFRIAQHSSLSRNLHIVDRIIRKKAGVQPVLESVEELNENHHEENPESLGRPKNDGESGVVSEGTSPVILISSTSQDESYDVETPTANPEMKILKKRKRRVGRPENPDLIQPSLRPGLTSPASIASPDNSTPVVEFVERNSRAAAELLARLQVDYLPRERSRSLPYIMETPGLISRSRRNSRTNTKPRSISVDHSPLPLKGNSLEAQNLFPDGGIEASPAEELTLAIPSSSSDQLTPTNTSPEDGEHKTRRRSHDRMQKRRQSEQDLQRLLKSGDDDALDSSCGAMGNRWKKALHQVRNCHYLDMLETVR